MLIKHMESLPLITNWASVWDIDIRKREGKKIKSEGCACGHLCVCVCVDICVCVCVCLCLHVHACVCVCAYLRVCGVHVHA